MKNCIIFITVTFLLFFSFKNINAQCGPTSVTATPQPEMICEGNSTVISFASTGTCSGSYEYEILDGATVVQPWSTTASFNASPIVTTTYTINVRCSACPTTTISSSFVVDVIENPTITGNLSLCPGETTTLTASGSTGNFEWWDSASGGTQLSATGTYTTPALASTTTYYINASGTIAGSGGSILITECGLEGAVGGTGSEDYIEVSNLYSTPINTTGWVVAVSSSYTNINSFNSTLWNLPNSFAPCSVVTRTDNSSASNYWGSNIYWNATSQSWAIIIDNLGNVVDFIAWGWSAADIAGFNPTINGFNITLGAEWTGNGCTLPCQTTGGVQYSFARTGNTDNNNNSDFICQPTSVDVVNPGLSCGWTAGVSCPFPVTVTVNPLSSATISAVGPFCETDGAINLSAVDPGGTWSGTGITDPILGTFDPTVAGPGNHSVTYTIPGSCGDTDTETIVVNSLPLVDAGIDQTACFGASITLSGSGANTYTWDNGVTDGSPFTINTPGTYMVTGTDVNGCINTDIINISISDPSYVDNVTSSSCGNSDGTITLTASNGVNPYQYSIDGGTSFQTSGSFVGLASGGYSIVVMDNVGCQVTGIANITDQGGPVIDLISSTAVLCFGSCDGNISINATGATQFSVDNGATFQAVNSFSNLCAGNYNIVVEDNFGCQAIGQAIVNEAVLLTTTINSEDLLCNGECIGEIDITAQGGASPYFYSLDNGVTLQQNPLFSGLCSGVYDVIVEDNNGCQTQGVNVLITEPPLLTMTLGVTNESCFGACDGMINSIPNGGTGSYNYNWTPAAGNLPLISSLCVGNYSLTISDDNNCTVTADTVISGLQAVIINSISVTDEQCAGDCLGTINVNATGATQYSIDGVNFQTSNVFTNLCANNYTVYIEDNNNCSATASTAVSSPNPITISAFNDTTICIGGSAQLSALCSGGTGNYSYVWDNGPLTQSISVSPSVDQNYCVTGTDQNGCSTSNICVAVTVNPPLSVQAFNDQTICNGDTASISSSATGGNGGPYTYSWDQGLSNGQTQMVGPVSTTIYTVTASDGCETPSVTATVEITVSPIPIISFTANQTSGCNPVEVTFTESNVPAGSQCFWDFGDGGTSTDCNSTSYTYDTQGCWDVGLNIITSDGCTADYNQSQYICVYNYPIAEFTYGPQPTTILNSTIDFENLSSGGTIYNWDIDGLQQFNTFDATYTFQDTGIFNVELIVISAEGCADTVMYPVIISPDLFVYVPNAITPNGDGVNDVFLPSVMGHIESSYRLLIYDRWGIAVFESQLENVGWDGKINGEFVKTDVYVWKLIVKSKATKYDEEFVGHVTVLR